nr:DegT/DnrJ/EryC1/StrS aminotransferase family protein [uncultured Sediminibacterium sp.]
MSDTFIPLASPDIREEDIEEVAKVLRTGNLVQGKSVYEFEQKVCNYLGVSDCIAVTNGTATMHLTLKALGISEGDEVIVPALSYIATANVVELVGATPVFVDTDTFSFNIDVKQIEGRITERTKAIIAVHEFGLAADILVIRKICDDHGLILIEDAACALGAMEQGRYAGSIGLAGSFSFHPRKAITSGEGGAIVTNDKKLANELRSLRNHGIDASRADMMDFVMPGFNCRMTDFQAALLLSQFKRFEDILQTKQRIADRYLLEIKNNKIVLPKVPETKCHSWQTFYLLLDDSLDQKSCIQRMKEMRIGTNYGAQCIPAQTYYYKKYQLNSEQEFPNAFRAYKQGLAIPLYEKLSDTQIDQIIKAVNSL